VLNSFAEIRPNERRAAYTAFFTLFGIMVGHALLETARDALFLAQIPPTQLPWVYLAVAVAALLIFSLQQRQGSARIRDHRSLSFWLLAAAIVTFLFWLMVLDPEPWMFYALYTWLGVFTTIVLIRYWILIGDLFTVTQAKRLFAPIGVGGVLGAIVGSGIARLLTSWFDPRELLLASSMAMALSALAPLLWPKPETTPPSKRSGLIEMAGTGMALPIRTILNRPYLRRVAELLFVSTAALTLVDFLFKFYVANTIAPDRLGTFFSGAYFVFNILSLFSQLVLVGWLVRALGVNRVLSVLPVLLAAASLGVLLVGGMIPILILKSFDGSLKHSLHRTSSEVLYVPLTTELRTRVKGMIDVVSQRGGQAVTSIVILLVAMRGPTIVILGVLILILCTAWIWIARRLKTHYLDLFRETLNEVSVQSRFEFPELDLASLEALIAALNSPNDSEVLATLDLLSEQGRAHLVPALILYHPSSRVVIRALELFTSSGREDFLPITDRLLEHRDPEVRAAILRARSWTAPSPALFEECASDPSPIVRATALIGMVSYGSSSAPEATKTIEEMAESGLNEEKLALARAIRYSPGAGYEDIVLELAKTQNPRVRLAVVAAMQEILSYRFIPRLMEMLTERNLRTQARTTLVAMGAPVLEKLDLALGDPGLDFPIRRQIPRAISQFTPQPAAEVLMRHLGREPDGSIRYRILRALGRLSASNPNLDLNKTQLYEVIQRTLEALFQVLDWKRVLKEGAERDSSRNTPVQELIVALLEHKEVLATERLFRLLGLLYPKDDLQNMYRGTRSTNRKVRSSSQELLEDLLEPPLREAVLALVDDIPDRQKLDRADGYHQLLGIDYETLLRSLLEKGGVGMRCLVAYHVGELRIVNLKEDLEALPPDSGEMIPRAVARATALLGRSDTKKVTDGSQS
jgi:ATP/ADP translocase/HEAT repeat protein